MPNGTGHCFRKWDWLNGLPCLRTRPVTATISLSSGSLSATACACSCASAAWKRRSTIPFPCTCRSASRGLATGKETSGRQRLARASRWRCRSMRSSQRVSSAMSSTRSGSSRGDEGRHGCRTRADLRFGAPAAAFLGGADRSVALSGYGSPASGPGHEGALQAFCSGDSLDHAQPPDDDGGSHLGLLPPLPSHPPSLSDLRLVGYGALEFFRPEHNGGHEPVSMGWDLAYPHLYAKNHLLPCGGLGRVCGPWVVVCGSCGPHGWHPGSP